MACATQLEGHHKVTIRDEAFVAAAELSDRYIGNRFLPDKAIDLIDQAAARVRIASTSRPAEIQELEAELAQLKREQDYAASRKWYDEAKVFEKRIQERKEHLEQITERWQQTQGRRPRRCGSRTSPRSSPGSPASRSPN